jgi:osmotically-inducible protein OsmY
VTSKADALRITDEEVQEEQSVMRKRRVSAAGMGAFLTAVLLAGCNSEDARNLSQDTRQLAQHAGESLGNAGLAGKVNTVLSLRKGVDMSGLHIEAKDGVITLSGHVRDSSERRRVLDTVEGIRGVEKVVADNLRVAGANAK